MFMKQSRESSDDYKLPLTVNETISEKDGYFYKAISNGSAWVRSHIAHIKSHKYMTSSRSLLQSITSLSVVLVVASLWKINKKCLNSTAYWTAPR